MKKKLQIALDEEGLRILESLYKEANSDFKNGTITYSAIINELLSNPKIDFKSLQIKYINLRKSLRLMAQDKNLDLDMAIKNLMEIKSRATKKSKSQTSFEGVN
jgi:hypothetical protein